MALCPHGIDVKAGHRCFVCERVPEQAPATPRDPQTGLCRNCDLAWWEHTPEEQRRCREEWAVLGPDGAAPAAPSGSPACRHSLRVDRDGRDLVVFMDGAEKCRVSPEDVRDEERVRAEVERDRAREDARLRGQERDAMRQRLYALNRLIDDLCACTNEKELYDVQSRARGLQEMP